MFRNFIKLFLLAIVVSSFFIIPALAAKTFDDAGSMLNEVVKPTGINTTQDLPSALGYWIKVVLSVVGVFFFVLMFYAGLLWMLARGEEEKITTAKNTLTMDIIGLFIIVSAYAITAFVTSRLITPGAGSKAGTETPELGDGPLGCCWDWTASGAAFFNTGGFRACGVTTETYCKFQGENENEDDKLFCPGPKEGCWYFIYKEDETGQNVYGNGEQGVAQCLADCETTVFK